MTRSAWLAIPTIALAALSATAQDRAADAELAEMEAAIVHLDPYRLYQPVEAYQCRNFETFYPLGAEVCVGGRVARCELMVNTMSWRRTGERCQVPAAPSGY